MLGRVLGLGPADLGLGLVYDVAHNVAKREKHQVGGKLKELIVHRKGATRALGPGHPELPGRYRAVGQPVLMPGDMGTASYVLCGHRPGHGRDLCQRGPRRGAGHEPHPGQKGRPRPGPSGRAGRPLGWSCARPAARPWPRRCPRPTKTWTKWSG